MDIMEAMKNRHSVRSYTDEKIEGEVLDTLHQAIAECNQASGLSIQLCLNEPAAFTGMMARYGKFNNVKNYIALVGKKSDVLEEQCGYYGEKIVLKAQQLGLNTCWVAMTFSKGKSKSAIKIKPSEKLLMVIPIGYGENSGVSHKVKSIEELSKVSGVMPDWFRSGMEAVQLAPTAMNQQKFTFVLNNDTVSTSAGSGFYTKVDLGIAKYHFEVGAGDSGWKWVPN
ncbi:nitroreductase family protein [Christensenellaceae bacterium OttesenSCG-928-M15]|nr:nitroreductase family protein [Christensenellaceae bacterium OttesenSCG-928-M15]